VLKTPLLKGRQGTFQGLEATQLLIVMTSIKDYKTPPAPKHGPNIVSKYFLAASIPNREG
jgi:hypothetical protein